ncbi:MAG: SPFH domain-containing protein [Pseudomonadota bacterium]|uniref:SPFH domain-containing protein n=1 Tax=Sphingomonas sp. ERG5 TaxID=1381597 RepID=UPI0006910DB5|nr:SPFH domain-containing protein [Sphingomonas sp. ERG5]
MLLPTMSFTLVPLGGIALLLALKSFGINQEYERGVVFRLGRLQATKGPGWFWLIPLVERVVKVDLRTITYSLDTQETVTRDGVAVRVNAVLWYRAFDAAGVVTTVTNWESAIVQAAETALRDAIGQSDLDQMLKDRTTINKRLHELLTLTCIRWGVEFDAVEIKDLDIPPQMQRAIAREAEAIREKRARIIKAEGEQEAARKLNEAATIIGGAPGALELRRLQTLAEIGVEHNSTIIAMFPTELLEAFKKLPGATG